MTYKHSVEKKEKIRVAKLKFWSSEKGIQRKKDLIEWNKTKKQKYITKEVKEGMKQKRLEWHKNHPNYLKDRNVTWGDKISEAKKGKTPKSYENLLRSVQQNPPMKGKHPSEETKRKISEKLKGRKITWKTFNEGHIPWNKNRKNCFNETTIKIMKEKAKQRGTFKLFNQNPDFQKKRLSACNKKPNKKEQFLINLIKENNLPFIYTGNGSVIIEGFNPDFVDNNGSKKIIEFNGYYWHNRLENIEKDRRKLETYLKHGYGTLIIMEDEIRNKQELLNRIKDFIKVE